VFVCEIICCCFAVEELENIGPDYARTLELWDQSFARAWPEISKSYCDVFYVREFVCFLFFCFDKVFLTRESGIITSNTVKLLSQRDPLAI
jgi:cyclopropane fatty-acyl-phospholipid synthase-like methyltransferase